MQNILFFLRDNLLISIALLLVFAELIWIVVLQINLSQFKRKKGLNIEGDAKSLEEIVFKQEQSIKALDKDIHELYEISNQINSLAFKSLHKFGIVRFNPFKDVGGDQSFAVALLSGKNNGVTISSLYTREGTRVYSKSIVAGKSEKHPLTEEEEQAIKIALSQGNNKKVNPVK